MYQNRFSQDAPGLSRHMAFGQTAARSKFSFNFDSYLLMILACVGIIGFSYVFYCFVNPDIGAESQQFTFNKAVVLPIMPDRNAHSSDLEITGSFESNKTLNFTLTAYNPEISYFLDFGNGEEIALTSDQCKYVYKSAGSYQLKMKALFNQKAKILYTKTVNIKNSISADNKLGLTKSRI